MISKLEANLEIQRYGLFWPYAHGGGGGKGVKRGGER